MFSLFYLITGNIILAKYLFFDFACLVIICIAIYLITDFIKYMKK